MYAHLSHSVYASILYWCHLSHICCVNQAVGQKALLRRCFRFYGPSTELWLLNLCDTIRLTYTDYSRLWDIVTNWKQIVTTSNTFIQHLLLGVHRPSWWGEKILLFALSAQSLTFLIISRDNVLNGVLRIRHGEEIRRSPVSKGRCNPVIFEGRQGFLRGSGIDHCWKNVKSSMILIMHVFIRTLFEVISFYTFLCHRSVVGTCDCGTNIAALCPLKRFPDPVWIWNRTWSPLDCKTMYHRNQSHSWLCWNFLILLFLPVYKQNLRMSHTLL